MSDGGKRRFSSVRLPRDTARLVEHLVEETSVWAGMIVDGHRDCHHEREQYKVLCYARKEICEHLEMLCAHAGVERQEDDVLLRFL